MINNPVRNIHTDYVANDVFKPKDANALAASVQYDYVITKERVDEYREAHELTQSDWLDVGDLLWENEDSPDYTCGGRAGAHILINFHTTIEDRFNFGGWLQGLQTNEVHIHSLSSYRATGTTLNIFFHTHGTENYALLDEAGGALYRAKPLHVGSFMLWDNGSGYPQWHASAPFVYEQCIEGPVPTGGSGETGVVVKQENWLSNGIGNGGGSGGGTHAVAVLLGYRLIGPDGGETTPNSRLPIQKVLHRKVHIAGLDDWKVVSRSEIPPGDTPVGTQAYESALVFRNTQGSSYLLPNPIFNNPYLEFRNSSGGWGAAGGGSYGIVLNDSFLNCKASSSQGTTTSYVSVQKGTTKLDVFTTVGFRIQNQQAKFPAYSYSLNLDDLANIGEGTVFELNIHIVGLPVARVNVNGLLLQHLFGDWDSTRSYRNGEMCVTNNGATPPTYRAWEWTGDNGIGGIDPTSTSSDNKWVEWEGSSSSNWQWSSPEMFPAIPGDSSGGDLCLYFRDGSTGSPLSIYAWGYGDTGTLVQGGKPINSPTDNYIYPTFEQPFTARASSPSTFSSASSTVPIIGSARIIFTRLKQTINGQEQSVIVLLNGGYNTARPAKRDDRVPI